MKITYNEKIKTEIEKSQNKLAQSNNSQSQKRPEKKIDCDRLSSKSKNAGYMDTFSL